MRVAPASPPPAEFPRRRAAEPVRRRIRVGDGRVWSFALLAGCWLLIFNQQRLEWTVNPTYGYGWAVPVLAAFLAWERWARRPAARPPRSGWWLLVPALLLAAYFPFRVIQEANPDWVRINWLLASVGIGLTFSATFAVGGWRYPLHFAFPILFCLTALPWPVWMEDSLVQALTRGNAAISSELLTIAGYPAFAKGNLIQIGTSWVNVEEACSGIRSLQTAFMTSLFFGEYYRFGIAARAALLFGSFGVAFVLNLARTITLTYLTGANGPETMEKWHDTVGNIVMLLCLVGLWLLAELFQRVRQRGLLAPLPPTPTTIHSGRAPLLFPRAFALAGLAWLGGAELGTEAWYRWHERSMPEPAAWTVAWPETEPGFRVAEFPERTRALLKYNEGETAAWRTADGYRWQMYYLRWHPGRVSKFLSSSHYPTVCLPATGLRLIAETGRFPVTVGGVTIPFATYLFDEGGRDVHVFHAIVEDVPSSDRHRLGYGQAKVGDRLDSVLRGERNLGQRVLGIALVGPLLPEDARQAVADLLEGLVRPAPSSASLPR